MEIMFLRDLAPLQVFLLLREHLNAESQHMAAVRCCDTSHLVCGASEMTDD